MNKSESITELAKAIVKAQEEVGKAHKDKKNPFFGSSYADLSSVWDACKEALSSNGFAILQPFCVRDSDVFIETILLHSSGEFISGELLLKPEKKTPQGMGSAITYGRRHSLSAMVGVCPIDDDAENATNRKKEREKLEKNNVKLLKVTALLNYINKEGGVPKDKINKQLEKYNVKFGQLEYLTEEQADSLIYRVEPAALKIKKKLEAEKGEK